MSLKFAQCAFPDEDHYRGSETDSDDQAEALDTEWGKGREREERPTDAKWVCYNGAPDFPDAEWLCDACERWTVDRLAGSDQRDIYPIVAIDLGRPHVWSMCQCDICIRDLIYADHIDDADFVVPAAATHLLDPHVLTMLMPWATDVPQVSLCDLCFSDVGSVRGWMPLMGSHVVRVEEGSRYRERERTRVAMVCCDRRNPMWGAVMIVDFGWSEFSMTWHGIEDDIDRLLQRWKRHPLRATEPRFARNWVEWAGEVYIDVVERSLDIERLAIEEEEYDGDDDGVW